MIDLACQVDRSGFGRVRLSGPITGQRLGRLYRRGQGSIATLGYPGSEPRGRHTDRDDGASGEVHFVDVGAPDRPSMLAALAREIADSSFLVIGSLLASPAPVRSLVTFGADRIRNPSLGQVPTLR
jgi:hypothetical protein